MYRFLLVLVAWCCLLNANVIYAQTNQIPDPQQTATDTGELSSSAAAEEEAEEEANYMQNDDTNSLQKAIEVYNQQHKPPIYDINEKTLIALVKAELIDRAEMKKYIEMVYIGGEVYVKEEPKEEKPDIPENQIGGDNKDCFIKSFVTACDELEAEKNRGTTSGNKVPELKLNLIERTIIYRDQNNRLKRMKIYSPPRFSPNKSEIDGKRGKVIKDYATSILIPKNPVSKNDDTAFEEMPSADTWIEKGTTPKQR
jgi:hypothetical protein